MELSSMSGIGPVRRASGKKTDKKPPSASAALACRSSSPKPENGPGVLEAFVPVAEEDFIQQCGRMKWVCPVY